MVQCVEQSNCKRLTDEFVTLYCAQNLKLLSFVYSFSFNVVRISWISMKENNMCDEAQKSLALGNVTEKFPKMKMKMILCLVVYFMRMANWMKRLHSKLIFLSVFFPHILGIVFSVRYPNTLNSTWIIIICSLCSYFVFYTIDVFLCRRLTV